MSASPLLGSVVEAVLLDLDDTLYPQAQYLALCVERVSARAAELGLEHAAFKDALELSIARGSGRGGTIDEALDELGGSHELLPELVEAFLSTSPDPGELTTYPGVLELLELLSARLPLLLVTDGDPRTQRAKLASLGIERFFTRVIITDEHGGRAARKPSPDAVLAVLDELGIDPSTCLMVGDRPSKDMALARATGMRSVRVATGEHAAAPSNPSPDAELDSVAHLGPILGLAPDHPLQG